MNNELRFKIITEGLKNGISVTCRRHDISRTIFYRWLKRYKAMGIEGLNDTKKTFVPKNKTNEEIERVILNLIRKYPHYGPRAINYLLEDLGYNISESAVFNVMKRNNLTNRKNRIQFLKDNEKEINNSLPSLTELKSGECWIFWITDYGYFKNIGTLYEYTLFDLKSRIACTRLYNDVSFDNFEDLLTAIAMPVASTINFKPNYLCFYKQVNLLKKSINHFKSKIGKIIQDNGLHVKLHILNSNDELVKINDLKKQYTKGCLSFLMPLLNKDTSFSELKLKFQDYVRNYNINYKVHYDQELYSPVEYHNKLTNTNLILPICVYIDRKY
ncbi:helix-turn-helix domain-containing protein [Haloplasma contractile]|uniref:Integrase catalytic subunit protein n=1 Tax=Haloplasma contractile SSD-17B TaxID=1033810 RepID=U2FKE2_9MOLU|nr:helix-turn-helix domain-containing protein [Haloplasma contractile]ERJ13280.1 integrase catalytic subunit protein [Haloplasma contractile SSD-17B]